MSAEFTRVHVLTRNAYLRGILHPHESPAGAAPTRLLDVLNSLARAKRQPGAAAKALPVLQLDHAEVVTYGASRVTVSCDAVFVPLTHVVVAFDETPGRSSESSPSIPPASYEVRMAPHQAPVWMLTHTSLRLGGKVRGGIKRLTARVTDEYFVPMTDVTIEDLGTAQQPPAELPFVAVNMDAVQAFWAS
jgi:hypothetical protein